MKWPKTKSSAPKKAGVIATIALSALLAGFGAALLTSCGNEDETMDASSLLPYSDESVEIRPLAAKNPEDFIDNPEATRAEILRLCYNQPESLANMIAAFPSLIEASELPFDGKAPTASNIDNLMDDAEVGAEIQQKMYDVLEDALSRSDTEFIFRSATDGWAQLRYACVRDTGKSLTPSNLGLIMVPIYIKEGDFVTIRIKTSNGSTEEATFDIATGFQYATTELFS